MHLWIKGSRKLNRWLIWSLIFLIISVSSSQAFEPQKHYVFSQNAARIYQLCTGRSLFSDWITAFAEGSVREDDISLTRALNWHFYNNGGKIGRYWKYFLICEGSNERIFKKRLQTLDHLIAEKRPFTEIYEAGGRVIHHIQDMSSPPHVMPIYHVNDDKFDKYQFDPKEMDVSRICEEATTEIYPPFDLLEQAAKKTLAAVERPVVFNDGKTFSGETWLKFWGGPDDERLRGFKTYGVYDNVFGKPRPCDNNVCALYNREVYDRFYNESYARALTDTVRFLIYLDDRISK